jgi:ADP-heptose:LPS heptosyltransferase
MIKNLLSWSLWIVAAFVVFPFLYLKQKSNKRTPLVNKRIVVYFQSKIGDSIAQSPVLRAIKTYYPHSKVTLILTEPAQESLFRASPYIDTLIVLPTSNRLMGKLLLVFRLLLHKPTLSYNFSSQTWIDFINIFALIPSRISIKPYGATSVNELLSKTFSTKYHEFPKGQYSTKFYVSLIVPVLEDVNLLDRKLHIAQEDITAVDRIINKQGIDTSSLIVDISCSSGNPLKNWPLANYSTLADLIVDKYKATILFSGSCSDTLMISDIINSMRHKSKAIDLSGQLTLGEFATLCTKINLLISADSGPIYVACATGIPTVNIAGPVDLAEQYVESPIWKSVQLSLPCVPCSFVSPHATVCKITTRECIVNITPEMVLAKVTEIIDARN